MGYRSDVYLKTTTEGWIIIQKVNNLRQEDEIWDVLDSYVMEEIARAVKEDI